MSSNYGFGGSTLSKAQQINNTVQSIGAAAVPITDAAMANSGNDIYQFTRGVKEVLAVSALITGDYYNNKAIQSFKNMDFTGSSPMGEYLQSIGYHKNAADSNINVNINGSSTTMKHSDFTAKQITQLQQTGSAVINGQTVCIENQANFNQALKNDYQNSARMNSISSGSKKDQLAAMRGIYDDGLKHMEGSANLSAIAGARSRGVDAVKQECAKAEHSINKQLSSLNRTADDNRLNHLLDKDMLSQNDISLANRYINNNKTLSAAEKEQFKQLLKDKTELSGFKNSGALAGGSVDAMKGQRRYAARIISSRMLGDMQLGVDIAVGTYKVTRTAVKATYAMTQNMAYHGAGAAYRLTKAPAKIADKAISRVTGKPTERLSKFTERMNQKRISSKQRSDAKRQAQKQGRMKEFKYGDRQRKMSLKDDRLTRKQIKNESKISGARAGKDKKLEEKLKKKNEKLSREQNRLRKKQARMSSRNKKRLDRRNKLNKIANKLATPFRALKKPFDLINMAINKIKAFITKICLVVVGSLLLPILIIGGASFAVLGIFTIFGGMEDEPTKLNTDQQYVKEICYGVMHEIGVPDEYAAAYISMWIKETGLNPGCLECDYILHPDVTTIDLTTLKEYTDRVVTCYNNSGISLNLSAYYTTIKGVTYGTPGGGLCQWTGERFLGMVAFADANKLNWYDLETNLAYLLNDKPIKFHGKQVDGGEYNTFKAYIKSASTPEAALHDVVPFERGGADFAYESDCEPDAKAVYDEIENGMTYDEEKVAEILKLAGYDIETLGPRNKKADTSKVNKYLTELKQYNKASAKRWAVIQKGVTLIGYTEYSMDKRQVNGTDKPKYLDCSSFVAWALNKGCGKEEVPWGSTTTTFLTSSKFTEIKKRQLKPGDIALSNRSMAAGASNHILIYCGKRKDGTEIWLHCTSGMAALSGASPGFGSTYAGCVSGVGLSRYSPSVYLRPTFYEEDAKKKEKKKK